MTDLPDEELEPEVGAEDSETEETEHVPEGYDTVELFLEEARERHKRGADFDRDNRYAGTEDLEFFAGEQWNSDDRAAREEAGKPCLVINRLPQFVAQVVGDIRINRPAIKVRPAEENDKPLAEVREGLIRAIERESGAQSVYAETGQSQVACGIGNFRIGLKYAGELSFNRDLFIGAIPDPFAVVWDPLSIDPTGKDAEWCFVDDKMDRKLFEKAWPDQVPSDLEVTQTGANGWTEADTVRVTEYWRVVQRDVEIALLANGEVVEIDDVKPEHDVVETRTTQRKYACMYLITGHAILAGPYEWKIDRVPIIRVRGWEIAVADRRIRFGLVRFAKDPQRLLNYWRSVAAEFLVSAPKGKWLVHETVDADAEDALRTSHLDDDPIIKWSGQVKPEYVGAPPIPASLLQEAQLNAQDMKDVTGLHDASLGARSNETSGRAIMARQREGDVATYVYHDNLRSAISEGGRVVNLMIPAVYDTTRTIRIIGEDEQAKIVKVNDPNNPETTDINRGRFDIAVETGPSYTTKRIEAAESMTAFLQAVPNAAPAIMDLLATAQDWPDADRIAERLKKMVPPQLLAGEDGAPEQPAAPPVDPMQQAAGQAQMAKLGAETRKAEADADKARADAVKASAEAVKAQAEVAVDQTAEMIEFLAGPVVADRFRKAMDLPMPKRSVSAMVDAGIAPPDFEAMASAGFNPGGQGLDMTFAAPPPQDFGQGMAPPEQPAPAEGFPAA